MSEKMNARDFLKELFDEYDKEKQNLLKWKKIRITDYKDENWKKTIEKEHRDGIAFQSDIDLTVFFAYILYKAKRVDFAPEKIAGFGIDNSNANGSRFKWNKEFTFYLNVDQPKRICYLNLMDAMLKQSPNCFDGVEFEFVQKTEQEKQEKENAMEKKSNYNIREHLENALNSSKQVIFTGAPGTGKTYSVRKYVQDQTKDDENRYKFVQFHPSYDYTDFVEGLRPVQLKEESNPTFVRLDGTFKEFCRKIVENNLEMALMSDTEGAIAKLTTEYNEKPKEEMKEPLEEYIKTRLIDEVYKKNKEKKKDNNASLPGWIERFNNPEDKYYFIVDEINRADLSKVFGELMFGLEETYRGIENRFDTQYCKLKTYKVQKDGTAKVMGFDCFKEGFFIPENLIFIGTMNDIDRSVESFDFALRRRFKWIEIKANEVMKESLKEILKESGSISVDDIEDISKKIINMNNVLTNEQYANFGLSEAYHIGPAYFKEYDGTENKLNTIFEQRIEPLIKEYTRGRDSKKVEKLIQACREKLKIADREELKTMKNN